MGSKRRTHIITAPPCLANKHWTLDGQLHRENGPAIEYADGSRVWYRHGERHRKDGPAVVRANGHKEWWINGRFVKDGIPHRDDGPAILCASGHESYWDNGVCTAVSMCDDCPMYRVAPNVHCSANGKQIPEDASSGDRAEHCPFPLKPE